MCLIITFCFIIICITGYLFIRKQYFLYNLLRFDPLEENINSQNPISISGKTSEIWLFGDSRITRWNKEHFSSLGGEIQNYGIEGQTSAQVLNRLKNNLGSGKPLWIFLEVGINDLKIIGQKRGLSNTIKEGCLDNIISIIQLCKVNNVGIVVMNIFPTGNIEILRRFVWNSSIDRAIIEINQRLETYCRQHDIRYFDAYNILAAGNQHVIKSYQDGFLHITCEAYEILSMKFIEQFGNEINSDLSKNKKETL